MKLLDFAAALKFGRKHRDAMEWLQCWGVVVEEAEWQSLQDVRQDYPKADGVKLKSEIVVTVFDVKGNRYRLLTSIDYVDGSVLVLEVMTHAEYSRNAWKVRY